MKAAIYARKSTDDNDRQEESKSVTRQVERATAYAEAKGWIVSKENIYIDDGISGAEFQNRPGFLRLLTHLKKFDVLIMSEPSRLGRDMLRNAYHVGEILDAGVRIFYYLTDEEEKAETPEQKIMLTLKSYASEVERQKASQRSRDALERKAQRGCNTGGRVYGYDNVWVYPDGRRVIAPSGQKDDGKSQTEYQINEPEAEIVRTIFRMYADGRGVGTIARTLNGDPRHREKSLHYFDGRTPPSPWKGTGSWSPSSVRAILHNVRYTGTIPFGKHRKMYKRGTETRVKQEEYLLIEAPHLRIVPDSLWKEVRLRQEAERKTYLLHTNGQRWGVPGVARESQYLLTGLARCAGCGANITVVGGKSGFPGKRWTIHYYGCSWHQNRGSTVCSNDHRERMPVVDGAVLDAIERQVLTPEAMAYTIQKAVRLVMEKQQQNPERSLSIQGEIKKQREELDRFLSLIADGNAPESVLAEIGKRERHLAFLEKGLQELQLPIPGEGDLRRIEKKLQEGIGRFRELMAGDIPRARQAIRKLLAEPLTFIPVVVEGRKTYTFEGRMRIGPLFSGEEQAEDAGDMELASPTGFEPVLPP